MNMKVLAGVVIIALFTLSAVTYISDLKGKYGVQANLTGFNKTESRLNEINEITNNTFYTQQKESVLPEGVTATFSVVRLGVKSIRLIWDSFILFVNDIPRDSYNILSENGLIPENTNWLLPAIFSLIMIGIIIWFGSALLRWQLG